MNATPLDTDFAQAWRHTGVVIRGAYRHTQVLEWVSTHESHWILLACIQGKLTATAATGAHELITGSVLLASPGMALQLRRSADAEVVDCQFSAFTDTGVQPPWVRLSLPWVVHGCNASALSTLPDGMDAQKDSRWLDADTAMMARFAVDRMLWQMAKISPQESMTCQAPPPPDWLRDALTAAHDHLHLVAFNVSGLAKLAGCSTNYLNSCIRISYGTTAQAMLRQLRIDRARHLLQQQPEINTAQLAAQCGFSSARHLLDQWRRATGESLSETRRVLSS